MLRCPVFCTFAAPQISQSTMPGSEQDSEKKDDAGGNSLLLTITGLQPAAFRGCRCCFSGFRSRQPALCSQWLSVNVHPESSCNRTRLLVFSLAPVLQGPFSIFLPCITRYVDSQKPFQRETHRPFFLEKPCALDHTSFVCVFAI